MYHVPEARFCTKLGHVSGASEPSVVRGSQLSSSLNQKAMADGPAAMPRRLPCAECAISPGRPAMAWPMGAPYPKSKNRK